MYIRWQPFYSDDDGGGDGGGSDDGGKVRVSDLRSQLGTTVDEQGLMRLLEKHAETLTDNHRLRDQRRALKQQLADATGKVPADGTRVLTADEAKAYDAYLALGKPDALKQAIDANGAASAELATLKRERTLAKAADAAGYKASVLTTLAGDLDIQVRPVKDGKPLVVVVKDGTETALADYAQAEWTDFLPALTATPGQQVYDINAGARGNGNGTTITEAERQAATARYRHTF